MRNRFFAILLVIMLFVSIMPVYPSTAKAIPLSPEIPVAISDSFTVNGADRFADGELIGTLTEVGHATWVGHGGFAFETNNDDSYLTSIYSLAGRAFVPFEPISDRFSVEMDIKPAGAGWSAFGFSSGSGSFSSDGELWMLVGDTGHYNVFADGTQHLLQSGTIVDFDANAYTHLRLQYDSAMQTLSAWANGERIVDDIDLGGVAGFSPDIQYAGLAYDSQTIGATAYDNFKVRGEVEGETLPPLTIFDSLAADGVNRKVGDALNDTATEIGARLWEASHAFVFEGDGVTTVSTGSITAAVPFVPAGTTLALEVEVKPSGMEGWAAAGFSSEPSALWSYGQLWMLVREDGYYNLWANGTQHLLASGTTLLSESTANVRLLYASDQHNVSLWINDVLVADAIDISGIAGWAPNIQYAGMMTTVQTSDLSFRNFAVRGEAQPVPPPYPDNIVQPEDSEFPLGVFEDANLYQGNKKSFKATVSELHGLGFDSIMMSNGDVYRDHSMLEATDRYGLDVYFHAAYNLAWLYDGNPDINEARTVAGDILAKIADRPSVKGINLSDEPTLDLVQNHDLLAQAFQEQNTGLTITTPLIGLDRTGPMFASADLDVMLIDIYPQGKANRIGNFNLNSYGMPAWNFVSYLRKVSENKPANKPLWIILQGFGQGGDEHLSRFDLRSPAIGELRAQNWLSIGEGVQGIFWFLYSSIPASSLNGMKDDPALLAEITDLVDRVKPLRPYLLEAKKDKDLFTVEATGNAAPYVSTLKSNDDEHTYVVAVNMDCEAPRTLTLDSGYFTGQLRNVETGQLYAIGASIPFAPGDGAMFEVVPTQTNAAPQVQLTAPLDRNVISGSTNITLSATASDDGGVAQVNFYANGVLIGPGTASGSTYSLLWEDVKAGSYGVTAVAVDHLGAQARSAPVSIMVYGGENVLDNPSFEELDANDDVVSWNNTIGSSLSTAVFHTGASAMQVNTPMNRVLLSQTVTLQSNMEYELSGWVKTDGIKGTGITLQYEQTVPETIIHETENVYGTTDWKRVSITFITPAYGHNGKVNLFVNVPYGSGMAWIDNISLVPTGKKEITAGLALHYSFDEMTGMVAHDTSINGRHGTMVANEEDLIAQVPSYLAGKIGSNSLFMQGADHYIAVDADYSLEEGFTIAAWIKPEESVRRQTIYSDGEQFELEIGNNGLQARVKNGSVWRSVGGGTLSSDQWYHVAAVYDEAAAGLKLYVDGAEVAADPGFAYAAGMADAHYIGQSPGSPETSYWGLLDDFKVYDRPMDPQELNRIVANLGIAPEVTEPEPKPEPITPVVPLPPQPDNRLTVSAQALTPSADGTIAVELGEGKSELLLPAGAQSLLAGRTLVVRGINETVDLSAETLKAAFAAAQTLAKPNGRLIIEIGKLPADQAAALVAQAGNSRLKLGLAGTVMTVGFASYSPDGTTAGLDAASLSSRLIVKYDENAVDERLLGFYRYDEAAGRWIYMPEGAIDRDRNEAVIEGAGLARIALMSYDRTFDDVAPSHWAYRTLKVMSALHLVNGTSEGAFDPGRLTTRAEFTAMLARALGLQATGKPLPFTDVNTASWYADSVSAAYESGLISGRSAAEFAPSGLLTREEMAVLLVRALTYGGQSRQPAADPATPTDLGQISAWAANAVGEALNTGLMQGIGAGKFAPQAHATRAETVQALYNLLNKG